MTIFNKYDNNNKMNKAIGNSRLCHWVHHLVVPPGESLWII